LTTPKLEVSNRELEQFAYLSSHDLKEPLRMITSFLELLQRKYLDIMDEDANEFINYAIQGAKRLDMMIDDLLEYSRIGKIRGELKDTKVENIVKLVLLNLKPLIDDNNASITCDPLPTIYVNEQDMVRLFQNLISNSIKYRGQKNPNIHISATVVHDEYLFALKDNGIGIEQNNLKKIFTIFQRLHTQNEYEGTGIGLAISQKIVLQYGGKIWAESE
jgi:chemotaxis family two-component system sensor kinase Cph1